MTKVTSTAIAIALPFYAAIWTAPAAHAASGDFVGVGAGTVAMATPTGMPAGTVATATATPTQTNTPLPTETFTPGFTIQQGDCAIAPAEQSATAWWLAALPIAAVWRRSRHRSDRSLRRSPSRSDRRQARRRRRDRS